MNYKTHRIPIFLMNVSIAPSASIQTSLVIWQNYHHRHHQSHHYIQKREYLAERQKLPIKAQKALDKKLAIKFPIPVKHIPPGPATRAPQAPATSPEEYKARLSAFVVRAGLIHFNQSNLNNKGRINKLVQALTHRSYKGPIPIEKNNLTLLPAMTPLPPDAVNDRFSVIGEAVLKLYLTEWIAWRYKNLPGDDLETAVDAYVGVAALAKIGRGLGVNRVMRWKYTGSETAIGETPVISSIIQSLIGLLYEEVSPKAAKEFIKVHITSRLVELESIIKLEKPKALLSQVFRQMKKERPVARLIKETGRQSHAPVFVVGMYSGATIVGEGYGSSLKMAETRAAKDALLTHFLSESKSVNIPSDMNDDSITFMVDEADLAPSSSSTTTTTTATTTLI